MLKVEYTYIFPFIQVPWSWMFMIAFVIIITDVILLITWQIVFNPRAVEVLREVSLNVNLMLIYNKLIQRRGVSLHSV